MMSPKSSAVRYQPDVNPTDQSFKRRAHALVDQLPETADWKGLACEASVMQDIEEGLHESEAGRVTDNAIVRKQFGLPE